MCICMQSAHYILFQANVSELEVFVGSASGYSLRKSQSLFMFSLPILMFDRVIFHVKVISALYITQ